MNQSQRIILVLGIIWALINVLFPPVLVPAAGLTGATHPFVEYPFWLTSSLPSVLGVMVPRLMEQLFVIFLLSAIALFLFRSKVNKEEYNAGGRSEAGIWPPAPKH